MREGNVAAVRAVNAKTRVSPAPMVRYAGGRVHWLFDRATLSDSAFVGLANDRGVFSSRPRRGGAAPPQEAAEALLSAWQAVSSQVTAVSQLFWLPLLHNSKQTGELST